MQETATLEEQVRSLRESMFLPNYCTDRQLAERLGVVPETEAGYIKEEGLPAPGKLGHN